MAVHFHKGKICFNGYLTEKDWTGIWLGSPFKYSSSCGTHHFFKNYAPLHSSYWHIWFFLRLTLINSCCQLQARSSQPEQKVSAFLSFFLSLKAGFSPMLLVPLFADFLIFPIELFLFSTAVKGYVYIWIYISILASTFMSTDTFSIFQMEPISIH